MKKILSLFALLMTIVIGAKATGYAPTADEVIILNDIKDDNATEAGFSKHAAIAWGAKPSASDKKAGDPNNGGEATSSNVKTFSVKGNSGKDITISITGVSKIIIYHEKHSERYVELRSGSKTGTIIGKGAANTYFTEVELTGTTDYSIFLHGAKASSNDDQDFYVYAIKLIKVAGPSITTQPKNAEYLIGSTTYPSMSVEAEASEGTLSYQWELSYDGENFEEIGKLLVPSAVTSTLLGSEAIGLLPDEAATYYLRCKVTDSNGSVYTDVATLNVIDDAPTITTDLETAYNVIKGKTLELSIVAAGASSYQWYLDGVAVEGATSASYTFTAGSTIGATNAVYCAAINAAGATNSATATITTVGRADCEVTNIQFSNGAYGAINNAIYGDGTIAVPYIAGTSAPTVEEASINISDGATYVLDGNTLTVTAEDGTTSKEYTINAVEITPLTVSADVAETSFTEVPSWVFNLYGWDKDKGLKFAKAVNDAGNMRIAKGNTRQYYFIGAAKSLTLTKVGSTRKVNVYVNGTKVISDTDNDALGTIALDETAPNLVIVEAAAGTNGDGGFSAYAIEAAAATIEVTLGANGYSTYCGDANFTVTSGATAYTATLSGTTVTLNEIAAGTVIGQGTGIVLVGTQGETAVLTPTTEAASSMELGNALKGVNAETTSIEANAYVLASNETKTSFVKAGDYGTVTALMNKAYIVYNGGMQEGSLDIQFEGEATAINNVNANDNADSAAPVKVIKNGKLFIGNYNVAGQLVK